VNLFRTRFAKGEAKEIIAPQKLSGNGCSLSLQGKRCRGDYVCYIITPAAPTVPCPEKQKTQK